MIDERLLNPLLGTVTGFEPASVFWTRAMYSRRHSPAQFLTKADKKIG